MSKKIVMRRCVVSRESYPKSELTRVVCNKDGEVSVDLTGKANGRGAYIKLTKENLANKKIKSSLSSSLKCKVDDDVIKMLERICNESSS